MAMIKGKVRGRREKSRVFAIHTEAVVRDVVVEVVVYVRMLAALCTGSLNASGGRFSRKHYLSNKTVFQDGIGRLLR